jgi:hypothetical protein
VPDDLLGHVHAWGPGRVIDYCHYQISERPCKACLVVSKVAVPRDFDSDPLQIAFADRNCETCRLTLRGREPWPTTGETDGESPER